MSKMSDEAIEERAKLCGFAIPRLILNYDEEGLTRLTETFCNALMGVVNEGGQHLTAKDAHTMLVLQSSEVLNEDTPLSFACFHKKDNDEGVQGQGESLILAGRKVGFASEFVQTQLFIRMGQSGEQLSNLLRWIPELGRYYFQHRVLNELVGTQGVALSPVASSGKEPWSLRFERVEAFSCRQVDVSCGVLYRNPPEADRMKSVDGLWVARRYPIFAAANHRKTTLRDSGQPSPRNSSDTSPSWHQEGGRSLHTPLPYRRFPAALQRWYPRAV